MEIKTFETFSGFSELKAMLRIQELVVEHTRSILKHNINECVHRVLNDQQRKFTLLVRGSFKIVPVDEQITEFFPTTWDDVSVNLSSAIAANILTLSRGWSTLEKGLSWVVGYFRLSWRL